jgi:SAM-dependent methyltransferase
MLGPGVTYADGAERRLLDILRGATDVSSGSDELDDAIADWPTRYHLSHLRSYLFRPLRLRPGLSVLDLGAGTGALARYVGEVGCDVLALEGSPARAEVAAERCRDLPLVDVACGTIDDLDPDQRFDVVTVIGVLEYSTAAIGGAGGPLRLLTSARQHLAEGGSLVLAIENQFGLKYLLGGAEDHRGAPWVGLEDYPGPPGPRTWSRSELSGLLAQAGFTSQTWLAPYPDYKLPSVIVHERLFDEPDAAELVSQLVLQPVAFPDNRPARLGDAPAAHAALVRAGLGREVPSSFLVVATAGAGPSDLVPDDVLAWMPGRHRRSPWRRERVLTTDRQVALRSSAGASQVGWLTQNPGKDRPFVVGRTLGQEVDDALRTHDLDALQSVLRRWEGELQVRSLAAHDGRPVTGSSPFAPREGSRALPPDHLDVSPTNFVDVDGALVLIDDEWIVDGGVDLELATIRALWTMAHSIVTSGIAHPWHPADTVGDVLERLTGLLGRTVAPGTFEVFVRAEIELQQVVNGASEDDLRADWLFAGRRGLDNRPDLQLAADHAALLAAHEQTNLDLEALRREVEGQRDHYLGLLAARDLEIARLRTIRGQVRARGRVVRDWWRERRRREG